MAEQLLRSAFFLRLGEILLPLATWLTITMPIWLSPFHPAVVAYIIITFDLYFLYQSIRTAYLASLSYRQIILNKRISYRQKLKTLLQSPNIKHVVIIPNYQEPCYKLEQTIQAITDNDYPYHHNLIVVLAFEKREASATQKFNYLKNKFQDRLSDILATYHELTPKEVAGKASNQTWATRKVAEYVEKREIDPQRVIITICDADSCLPTNYFSYLTFLYLTDKEHLFHFYWAPTMLYNNFWQLPFFVRMQATLSSILRLAFLSNKNNLIQISTYSTNLWLLKQINYWDVDIIPEDWHIYFQAFFRFGEKVKTLPMYTIVSGDAVYSGKLIKTLINRYEQEKRWAWGVTDVAYFWKNIFTTPHIGWGIKLKKFLFLAENHFLWPTTFFMLTLSGFIPPLINPIFKRTVLGFILPQLSGLILTLATLMLFLYIYLDIQLRKKIKISTKTHSLPLLLVQWYLLPIVSLVLSSLPALDAHTRLLFGKKINYKVTEKV